MSKYMPFLKFSVSEKDNRQAGTIPNSEKARKDPFGLGAPLPPQSLPPEVPINESLKGRMVINAHS